MGSFVLRLKRLRYLASNFQKIKTLQSCGSSERNMQTCCALFSNITKQFIIHDLRGSSQAAKNSDFGKVVDLEYDFDQLRADDDYSGRAEIKKKQTPRKNTKKMRQFEKPVPAEEVQDMGLGEEEIELDPEGMKYELENNELEKKKFQLSKDINSNDFRHIMTSLKSRKIRLKKGKIILEGKRIIQDALSAGQKPLKIFFTRFSDLRTLNLPEDVEVIQVPYKTLNLWSEVATSQGVIGVFKMPNLKQSKRASNIIPLTVICDSVKDPGNLGSIIRTVAAVGGQKLILTTGCVDIWSPKVLRTGAGAHFHLLIETNFEWSDIESIIPEERQIVLADNQVPVESDEPSEDEKGEGSHTKNSLFKNSSELAQSLPLLCYTSFTCKEQGAVIVLGGETSGLSDEAYQFAINRNGSRVYVPMGHGMESLNNAMCLGIILYEFRRQLNCIGNEEMKDQDSSAVEKSQ